MIRRRIPLTAIISSSLVAGGLFMLDLPKHEESKHQSLLPHAEQVSLESHVSVGTSAEAAINSKKPSPARTALPESYTQTLEVGNGDTLMEILVAANVNPGDAYTAIKALSTAYDPRRIRPKQKIRVTFQPGLHDDMPHTFEEMRLNVGFNKSIRVTRAENGEYQAAEEAQDLVTTLQRAEGTIDSSLYLAATEAGMPASLLMEFIFAYSFDVDFQRDIQKGDKFEIMYEKVSTEDGKRSKIGNILFASLSLSGERLPIYRYEDTTGHVAYYNDKGHGAQKALMRTPINGARLSSGFGKRTHPILGYSKMHTGVDFAAPSGTPIYAAGDGVLDFAGRKGGYGKYIRIRHNSEFETAYAHMRAFKTGMSVGKRVKQGEVIGYVGTTGRSTGAHLHYEIIRNGGKVNPLRVHMPSGITLQGKELNRFMEARSTYLEEYASLAPATPRAQVASAQ
jgi:murein DD-endopeptidase MepM/ murein hydrolase activator NlpD